MRIGWGTGITIFYVCFVLVLLFVLKKSKEFDHSLVVEDYYRHDIHYQEHLDKLSNSQALINKLNIQVDRAEERIKVQFPKGIEEVQGTIHFFRASDRSKDFTITIHPNQDNLQFIPTQPLVNGLWTLKVNWYGGSTPFYDEQKIVL